VHTRWIETEYDNRLTPYAGPAAEAPQAGAREAIVVEVGGKRLEVVLPAALSIGTVAAAGPATAAPGARPAARRSGAGPASKKRAGAAASGDALTSPMQGTIVKVAVAEGATVAAGDLVVVLEAMKMEQPLTAHKAGTVTGLQAEVGATVTSGTVLCELKD